MTEHDIGDLVSAGGGDRRRPMTTKDDECRLLLIAGTRSPGSAPPADADPTKPNIA
jgi:hypothetical protein